MRNLIPFSSTNIAYTFYIHIPYPPKDNCSKCRHSLFNEWFAAFLFSVWLMKWASTALSFVYICILLSFCFPKLFNFTVAPFALVAFPLYLYLLCGCLSISSSVKNLLNLCFKIYGSVQFSSVRFECCLLILI